MTDNPTDRLEPGWLYKQEGEKWVKFVRLHPDTIKPVVLPPKLARKVRWAKPAYEGQR